MIKIYTTPTCVFCEMAKEFFRGKGIKYKEYDVSSNKEAQQEMIEKSHQYGVPVIDINGKILIGFDRVELEKALNKLKIKNLKLKINTNVRPSNRGRRPSRRGSRCLRRQKKA
jgi:glutaredoxin-like YruB-family protein